MMFRDILVLLATQLLCLTLAAEMPSEIRERWEDIVIYFYLITFQQTNFACLQLGKPAEYFRTYISLYKHKYNL